jgi:hypothetical protein
LAYRFVRKTDHLDGYWTFNCRLYKAHLEVMYKGLLIHLDDPDGTIQDAVADVLRELATLAPDVLAAYAKAAKGKHRDSRRCEKIQIFAEQAHRSGSSSESGTAEVVEAIATGELGEGGSGDGGDQADIPEIIQRDAAGRPKDGERESIGDGSEMVAEIRSKSGTN